jgi:UPF0271 protein
MDVYTTSLAVSEVRDLENHQALLEAIDIGLINITDPEKQYVNTILLEAKNTGALSKLSTTDIYIVALALMLREKYSNVYSNVIVITDDYELQNLLLDIKISFKPLKTTGITRFIKYTVYCPICYYTPSNPGETTCPLCGVKLTRKPAL